MRSEAGHKRIRADAGLDDAATARAAGSGASVVGEDSPRETHEDMVLAVAGIATFSSTDADKRARREVSATSTHSEAGSGTMVLAAPALEDVPVSVARVSTFNRTANSAFQTVFTNLRRAPTSAFWAPELYGGEPPVSKKALTHDKLAWLNAAAKLSALKAAASKSTDDEKKDSAASSTAAAAGSRG